jgi:transcriptional regulator with PAS, ATPase and Fis domain
MGRVDTTGRRTPRTAAKAAEVSARWDLCRSLIDAAPLPMAAVEGPQHVIRAVNPAFCRLLEAAEDRVVGRPFAAAVPAWAGSQAVLDRVARTGEAAAVMDQPQARSGSGLWSCLVWPVRGPRGRPMGLLLLVPDTPATEQFRHQLTAMNEALVVSSVEQHARTDAAEAVTAQVTAQNVLLETILEQAAEEIVVRDPQGRLLLANAEARRGLLPGGPAALEGTPLEAVPALWGALGDADGQPLPLDAYPTARALRGERVPPLEVQRVAPDGGMRALLSSAVPLRDPRGALLGAVSISADITLQKQKDAEIAYLRQATLAQPGDIIGTSRALQQALAQATQVAPTDAAVLLLGETGTGKELLAHLLHRRSKRQDRSLVTVNCAALPPTLIEAELFGREKGAYTGALSRQAGRFELAHGSTLFLDEIAELPLELQGKLLRVVEEGQLERLGSTKTIKVDVRVIAATNRDLAQLVASKLFREDLYYRLNVFPIVVPPLRDRREDIPLLVWAFAQHYGKAFGKPVKRIPQETMLALRRYPWPGNIRELRNVIERAVILSDSSTLRVPLEPVSGPGPAAPPTLAEAGTAQIRAALEQTGWRIRGPAGAAARLGLKPTTLESRIKKLGLTRSR